MTPKRALDVLLSLIGILLLLPMFLVVSILIKLDSRGPIVFRQERVGRHGKIFRIRKFRTMQHGISGTGSPVTAASDPRITRVGRVLRRYKIDEFPQLLDVLMGNMSLVGPRPEVPLFVNLYSDRQREVILSVPPGITDPASLHYFDEAKILAEARDPMDAYINAVLPHKLAIYERYVRTRTLLGDVAIIVATLRRTISA